MKTGQEKEWVYLIRFSNPDGGPISPVQWQLLDEFSEKYTADPKGRTSLRLTRRQNIQFHWVKKTAILEIVKTLGKNGLKSLNGCGDNTRNVMACPISRFSPVFNANKWAQNVAEYFQLPLEPFIKIFAIDPNYVRTPEASFSYGPRLLNRKFKIAFSSVHFNPATGEYMPDNCVEVRTHDAGVVPIIKNGELAQFQIYLGDGQGERNGKPGMAVLGLPFCRIKKEDLIPALDAIVKVRQEWGDRKKPPVGLIKISYSGKRHRVVPQRG